MPAARDKVVADGAAMKNPVIVDMFCGSGGESQGIKQSAEKAGLNIRMCAINHWQRAIETHKANFPDAEHICRDVQDINPSEVIPDRKVALLWASPACTHFSNARGGKPCDDQRRVTPFTVLDWLDKLTVDRVIIENVPEFCFPEETAVLSKRGIVPINSLKVGDEVWTHNARWKPIMQISRKTAKTIRIKGYGNSIIETTPNHEFYAREVFPEITKSGKFGQHKSRLLEPEWVKAEELTDKNKSSSYKNKYSGYAWATPIVLPHYWMRLPDTLGVDASAPSFFYMIGRWLGDGWIKKRKARQDLIRICANVNEADDLECHLKETGLTWYRHRHSKNVDVFDLDAVGSKNLIHWIRFNFGEYAHKKTLPAWIFGASDEQKWALINGYHDADGHEQGNGRIASSSVSRCLSVGIRLLLQSLGIAASISRIGARTARAVEDKNKTMNCRETFSVSWNRNIEWEKCYRGDLHLWGRVREISQCRDNVDVIDISVADDHSFIADGQVVHNCSWGPLDEATHRPIPEMKGTTFEAFINMIRALGYSVDWNVMNAADYGAPTTRKRLFIQAVRVREGSGKSILWPGPTHAALTKNRTLTEMQPWIPARKIIDWNQPSESIFSRRRPLAERTMQRIREGLSRFGGAEFLICMEHGGRVVSADVPVPTITTARGGAIGLAQPFIVEYYGKGQPRPLSAPLPTVTTRDRFALIEPKQDNNGIDIRFRMLTPEELAAAQSFPENYIFTGTREEKVTQIGNAVCPRMAEALTLDYMRELVGVTA